MKRTGKLLVSTMIAAAGAVSTALALSTTAAAEPAPPANPGVPGMEILSQLSNVQAAAPQVIQSIASALAGTPATPVTPAAPAPGATASVTLPQPPALPAAATPAAARRPPAAAPGNLLSNVPLLSALPDQLATPASLAKLLPSGVPMPNLGAPAATAPIATAPLVATAPRSSTRRCGAGGSTRSTGRGRPPAHDGAQRPAVTPEANRHTTEPWENHVTDREAVRQRRRRGRLIGSNAVGSDGYRQRRPGVAAADRSPAGAGHVGGAKHRPGDSAGGRRSDQRGVDVDGGRGGVHR